MPFAAASDYELMREHLEKAPPPARFLVPSLPPELDEMLAKTLAKAPSDRFQSASELRQALETIAADLPLDAVSSGHSVSPKSPPTADLLNGGRYATAQLEDRYTTRVQGTPLPTSPIARAPIAPVPVINSTPTTAGNAPPQPTSKRWLWPAAGALLVAVSLATAAVLRPAAKVIAPTKLSAPRANRVLAARATVPLAPRRVTAASRPFTPRLPRNIPTRASRIAPRVRLVAPREMPRRRVRLTAPHHLVAPRVIVAKREARRPLARGVGAEQATLRAIIKGH